MSSPLSQLVQHGTALIEAGQLAEAAAILRKAAMIAPNQSEPPHLLGVALLRAGNPAAALDAFDRAIRLQPRLPDPHSHRGHALKALGRRDDALASYREAVRLRPSYAEMHYNLANALREAEQLTEAEAEYKTALRLKPGLGHAHNNLGNLYRMQERYGEAAEHFQAALRLLPDAPELRFNLATVLAKAGRREEAVAAYRDVVARDPDNLEARRLYASILTEAGRATEAIDDLRILLDRNPDDRDLHTAMMDAMSELGRFEEAEVHGRAVIRLKPDDPGARNNMGVLHASMRRYEDAIADYREALRLEPENHGHSVGLGLMLLHAGDYRSGWDAYEARLAAGGIRLSMPLPQDLPPWRGEDVAGKRLLLWWEQGFGDTIQFARYAAVAAERGATVTLCVQRPLVRLMQGVAGAQVVLADGDPLPPQDLHCQLMSAAKACGTTRETIPAPQRYLQAAPDAVAAWRERLRELPGLRVGIAWAGNPGFAFDRHRSVPAAALQALAGLADVSFVSLQKGVPAPEFVAADWTAELADFADTAALMTALDMVVAVDTAAAHLAGALGCRVFLLNRYDTDWRWCPPGSTTTPWYPTMRIVNQQRPRDWTEPLAELRALLAERAADQAGAVTSSSPR